MNDKIPPKPKLIDLGKLLGVPLDREDVMVLLDNMLSSNEWDARELNRYALQEGLTGIFDDPTKLDYFKEILYGLEEKIRKSIIFFEEIERMISK